MTKDFIDWLLLFKEKGVIIYGMGYNGQKTFNFLKERKIDIWAIIDKKHITYCDTESIELEQSYLYDGDTPVIISPDNANTICSVEIDILGKHFQNIVMMPMINRMMASVPDKKKYGLNAFFDAHTFNHYESPYSDLNYVKEHEVSIFNNEKRNIDIDYNEEAQLTLMRTIKSYYDEVPKWDTLDNKELSDFRYAYNNPMFSGGDAILLCSMLRIIKPKKIIEIGSGFSTCVMLDVNEKFFANQLEITCIEPYPERLYSNIKQTDSLTVYKDFVQNISLELFSGLEEGDILFIDSSHVAKPGGDVNYELFEILPYLRKGVLIHFHDIFWTFEYPKEWIWEGRTYNESYIIQALLMGSNKYEIVFFNNMMIELHKKMYLKDWPGKDEISGGSLWLRKR